MFVRKMRNANENINLEYYNIIRDIKKIKKQSNGQERLGYQRNVETSSMHHHTRMTASRRAKSITINIAIHQPDFVSVVRINQSFMYILTVYSATYLLSAE